MPSAGLYRAATVVLGLYSVVLTSFVVARARQPDPSVLKIEEIDARVAAAAHQGAVLHAAASPTTDLTIWTDYQCPYCRKLDAAVDSLRPDLLQHMRIRVRHYPLNFHPKARTLAALSICAEATGQFVRVHRMLFQRQTDTTLIANGRFTTGVVSRDSVAVATCMAGGRPQTQLAADSAAGKKLGITGTPLLLINRTLVHGTVSAATLDSLITAAQASARGS